MHENQRHCCSTAALAAAGRRRRRRRRTRVVNVYNWSDYIDEEVLEQFTEETGIKVVYDVYDNNDIVETKLLAGGSGYDIVVPTDSQHVAADQGRHADAARQVEAPQPRPHVAVHHGEAGQLRPGQRVRRQLHVGNHRHRLSTSTRSRSGSARAPLDTWDIVFKPENAAKLADCGIYMLDAPEDIIQSTLAYLGLTPNSKDPADIEKAGEVLQAVRPYIQKFHSSEYINALANGDICLAIGYSGDILQARDRAAEANNGVEIEYLDPEGGRADVVRQLRHPGRCAASGRGAMPSSTS